MYLTYVNPLKQEMLYSLDIWKENYILGDKMRTFVRIDNFSFLITCFSSWPQKVSEVSGCYCVILHFLLFTICQLRLAIYVPSLRVSWRCYLDCDKQKILDFKKQKMYLLVLVELYFVHLIVYRSMFYTKTISFYQNLW